MLAYVGRIHNLKDLKDDEEVREAWSALAAPGAGGAVVQAYPVGQVVRRSGRDVELYSQL